MKQTAGIRITGLLTEIAEPDSEWRRSLPWRMRVRLTISMWKLRLSFLRGYIKGRWIRLNTPSQN